MQHRRYRLLVALIVMFGTAAPAVLLAQNGRVSGIVRDEAGRPIRGATVTASRPEAGPATFTATTDERGQFAMIGLSPGNWQFTAQAPGHTSEGGRMPVRADSRRNPTMAFSLARAPGTTGPLGNVSADDLQTRLAGADALFDEQRWDEAIAAYHAVLSATPALTVVNLQIGAAYRAKQDFEGAVAAYRELLKVDPDNGLARVGIAMAYLERGDAAAAEATLSRVGETPEASRDVLFALGDIKMTQGDADAAVQWYRRSAEVDPSWGKPRYKMAEVALGAGDTETAVTLLRDVVTVDPESPESALAREELARLNR